MPYIKPLFDEGIRYGLGTADGDVKAAHVATVSGGDTFALSDTTSQPFGLFVKDAKAGEMPAVYCCGGIYETDTFEGTLAPGDPLTTHTNGKRTAAPRKPTASSAR